MKQRMPAGSVLTNEEDNPRILSEMGNKPNSRANEVTDQEPDADQQWTQYTQSENVEAWLMTVVPTNLLADSARWSQLNHNFSVSKSRSWQHTCIEEVFSYK